GNELTDQTSSQSVQPPKDQLAKKQQLPDDTTNESSQKDIQPAYPETEGFGDTISSLNESARENSVQPSSQALLAAIALFHDLPSTVSQKEQDSYYTKNLWAIEDTNPQLFKEILV